MKILSVVGARPNFMKAAPIIAAIAEHNKTALTHSTELEARSAETIQHVLVHTGQHYDDLMSGSFFRDLELPPPDVHLGVGPGSHAAQTAEIMRRFEGVLVEQRPDVVVVVGDVNSTLACALVASKMPNDVRGSRPLIAHVEAGLRSFDRSMPEEINRILTDHVADLLFVTEESGLRNLHREGIAHATVHFVGNTMIDSLLAFTGRADASTILDDLGLRIATPTNDGAPPISDYLLLTLHRPTNVDNRSRLVDILAGLQEQATNLPIVFPVHPRTRQRLREFGLETELGVNGSQVGRAGDSRHGIILTDPLSYLDFVCLMKHARLVVTDSGGIQEETTCLRVPCVTVRENTERPVTVESGTNIIAGTRTETIKAAIRRQLERKFPTDIPKKWDGHAAARIVDTLVHAQQKRLLQSAHDGE